MAKKSKSAVKTAAIEMPADLDEVEDYIALIGDEQRARAEIETAMNAELAAARARYEAEARGHAEEIARLAKAVQAYCEAHREALTKGGRNKTVQLGSGSVAWRLRPPAVRIARGALEAAIAALKAARMGRFVRVKEELDKEAILANPEKIEGIEGLSIVQCEDFVVTPFETKLEEVRR